MAIQILIADDNPIVRGALRQVLETEGQGLWQIFDAENGQDAISLAQQIRPSLVILDLAMPLKDGLRTAREISQILPGTPIVLHTLYWSHRVVIEAMKAGIRKTVPKSESAVLVAAVRELLEETAPAPNPENNFRSRMHSRASPSQLRLVPTRRPRMNLKKCPKRKSLLRTNRDACKTAHASGRQGSNCRDSFHGTKEESLGSHGGNRVPKYEIFRTPFRSFDALHCLRSKMEGAVEQRIRELCARLVDAEDPESARDISFELQAAIHAHVESLRKKLLQVPAQPLSTL